MISLYSGDVISLFLYFSLLYFERFDLSDMLVKVLLLY